MTPSIHSFNTQEFEASGVCSLHVGFGPAWMHIREQALLFINVPLHSHLLVKGRKDIIRPESPQAECKQLAPCCLWSNQLLIPAME